MSVYRKGVGKLYEDISPLYLAAELAAGEIWQLIDVRESWEIEIASVRQSIHIPMVEIPAACADMVLNFTTTASLPGRQGASES